MKKILAAILIAAFLFVSPVRARADDEPKVSAGAFVLMEAGTGEVLLEKNDDERMLIASTTKIMTALVVLEHENLDEEVTICPEWTNIEGSSMYLAAGQSYTVRELLYGMMLASGNDAAVALACHTAGSVDAFAALMNAEAASLGCTNTHFENPNGLDSDGHYSSARDLAVITRKAIQNDDFCSIVSCKSITIGSNTFSNHNRLLRECEGVFGVKTGYTEAAGRSLVTCCEREGMTLICVTLSDPDDWDDHAALYDWAYGIYTTAAVLPEVNVCDMPVIGGIASSVPVKPEGNLCLLRRKDAEVTVQYNLPEFAYAGIHEGETAGTAAVYVDGVRIGELRLVYAGSVERNAAERLDFRERILRFLRLAGRNIYLLS